MWDWRSYIAFQGRLNRQPYWLMNLILFGVAIVCFIVVAMLAALSVFFWILGVPLYFAFLVAGVSIATRRLHDRNKSAWWLLLYQGVPGLLGLFQALGQISGSPQTGMPALVGLISLGISLWALVDLGILKGTTGPNRFGDDPLGPAVGEVFA